jgi:hypothetical protein
LVRILQGTDNCLLQGHRKPWAKADLSNCGEVELSKVVRWAIGLQVLDQESDLIFISEGLSLEKRQRVRIARFMLDFVKPLVLDALKPSKGFRSLKPGLKAFWIELNFYAGWTIGKDVPVMKRIGGLSHAKYV